MRLYTQKEVIKRLKIPFYRLEYLHKTGQIPEAKRTSSGMRVYTDYDIDEIGEILLKQRKRFKKG